MNEGRVSDHAHTRPIPPMDTGHITNSARHVNPPTTSRPPSPYLPVFPTPVPSPPPTPQLCTTRTTWLGTTASVGCPGHKRRPRHRERPCAETAEVLCQPKDPAEAGLGPPTLSNLAPGVKAPPWIRIRAGQNADRDPNPRPRPRPGASMARPHWRGSSCRARPRWRGPGPATRVPAWSRPAPGGQQHARASYRVCATHGRARMRVLTSRRARSARPPRRTGTTSTRGCRGTTDRAGACGHGSVDDAPLCVGEQGPVEVIGTLDVAEEGTPRRAGSCS